MEAQRLKTRGPNPNPTAQAQSKRCLPLSTKPPNIIETVSILASILGAFFLAFSTKVARWVQSNTQKCPQDTTMDPKGTQMEPQGAEMKPQGLPKVAKRLQTAPHACQN